MWFKQAQVFQLTDTIKYLPEKMTEQLEAFAFTPCPPSFAHSMGWVSPIDEEGASLVQAMNGYIMICLQIEEKILPASVIRQALVDKVKKIEKADDRKVRSKEKLALKDEVVLTLLPRAFTKLTRMYAYIDIKNNWLVLGSTNATKNEQFFSMFKKSITEGIKAFELKKISPELTHWIKNQSNPTVFSIEKACLLQDREQQNRIIRCQHQDLFAPSIQSLIKDGCEVKQLAICWHDRVNFVLVDDFSLRSIKYQDEVLAQAKEMDAETRLQQFAADFFIMTEVLAALVTDLLALFVKEMEEVKKAVA